MELISREEALMNARPEYLNPNQEKLASYNQGWNNAVEMYCRQIAELPIVEEQKEGKWTVERRGSGKGWDFWYVFVCSKCHEDVKRTTAYCPNCGARMQSQINTAENTNENE